MFRHKLFGIAAAATLGLAAVLGSTGAYAVKIVPNTSTLATDASAMDSVTYAAETFLTGDMTAASDEDDTTAYYNIGGDDLFIAGPADITASAGDIYVVAFALEGMVIQTQLLATNLDGGTFGLAAGGAPGDKMAVFRLTSGGIATTATNLVLEANFAISAAGSGTIKRTVTNQTLASLNVPGVSGTMTHTSSGIIKVAAALDEKSTKLNPTAEVAEGFKLFLNDRNTASVGTLTVGVVEPAHRSASTGADVGAVNELLDPTLTDTTPNSSVTFMGDFSFASRVFTHGDADCGAAGTDAHVANPNTDEEVAANEPDLLMRDDDDMVTDTTMTSAVNVTEFETARHLCIMVQGEDSDDMVAPRIPATPAYMAMGSYEGIEDAAIGPMPEEQTLGMIGRNGTTVRLPYLTTNAKFSQRIRIVNRGGMAGYTLDFQSGDTPPSIDGTLDAESITDLFVGGEKGIIEMIGGGRGATAGSLIIESQPTLIDVVTIQISRELGTTDTVAYQPE